ncbi:ARM repeat-containing protein [Anaeromyces robustus]|uniref:ARM repeat-containing protein n=1 Tax=Anaeromyces robustus TaxID=1754192 RepID=A0A1Y1X1X3_9FUNG|nr:ARM repeat-containing protein [Anaeromyces robustus]|eukprot:ORX79807.1 ARM repeat-containing protein [Anaeromyces robustus]
MSNIEIIYNHFLSVFNSLNNSLDSDAYKSNLKWLEDYQKTNNAWYISVEILKNNEENLDLKLFSSQTLRQKIIYELQDLKQDAIELKNSLTYLLFINKDKPNPIIIQLCLALADLAILCDEWDNPIEEICELYGKNSEMISILFQFLAFIPEELNNEQLKLSSRKAKIKEKVLINNIVNNIIDLLSYYAKESCNDAKLKTNINNCIYSWIKYKAIDPNTVIESPLMSYILSELVNNNDIDEIIGNTLNELIIISSSSPKTNKELINEITPTIFEISNYISNITSEDTFLVYSLIFETYAEYNIYNIIENYDDYQFITSSLIKLYSINVSNIEISYHFWTLLQEQLNNIGYQVYKPQFIEVYTILQEKTLDLYKMISFNKTCDISLDVLEIMFQNCFLMLNENELLNSFCESFKNELCGKNEKGDFNNVSINNMEIQLFYLYSIIFNLNDDHRNIIRDIIKMIPYFPNNNKIKNLIIKIIGDLSEYSYNNKIEIESQLNYLITFLENENDRYQGLSSLLEFTRYCGMYLTNFLDEFCNFYLKVINIFNYSDLYALLKSICNILIYIPKENLYYYQNKLNLPLIEKLNLFTSDEYINNPNNNINTITCDIRDILSYISLLFSMKLKQNISINESHPLVDLYNNYHPVLSRILDLCQNEERIIQELCNCYIDIMNTCTYHILPTIKNLLEKIVIMYNNTKFNCYLWVFNQSIKLYMNESKKDTYDFLLNIFQKITNIIFSINSNELINYSYALEEYFHLCNQILIESPSYIFNEHSIISQIIEFSWQCLDLNNIEIEYEIIDLYSEIFNDYNIDMLTSAINYDIIKNSIKTVINLYIENIEKLLSTNLASGILSLILKIYDKSSEELLEVMKELLLDYSNLLNSEESEYVLTAFTNACRNEDEDEISIIFEKLKYLFNKKKISSSQNYI